MDYDLDLDQKWAGLKECMRTSLCVTMSEKEMEERERETEREIDRRTEREREECEK